MGLIGNDSHNLVSKREKKCGGNNKSSQKVSSKKISGSNNNRRQAVSVATSCTHSSKKQREWRGEQRERKEEATKEVELMSQKTPCLRRVEKCSPKPLISNAVKNTLINVFPKRIDVDSLNMSLNKGCLRGDLKMVRQLIKTTAADVNFQSKNYSHTPLTAASGMGHLEIVKLLLLKGADVNMTSLDGRTPLAEAAYAAEAKIELYLLEYRDMVFVNIWDKYGNTALLYTIWKSKHSESPLHRACAKSDIDELYNNLYLNWAHINTQNNFGDTPLHIACFNGHYKCVELLILAGADVTITNDQRQTPAMVACSEQHTELLALLDFNIASVNRLFAMLRRVTLCAMVALVAHNRAALKWNIVMNKKQFKRIS